MKRIVFTLLLFVCAFAGLKAQTVFSEHEDAKWGVAMGYVSKDWRTDFGSGYTYKENLWGEEDKRFHGMQVGVFYQPCFKWGLGIYTGLFYEGYISLSSKMEYDEFVEHSGYIPLHLSYRIPLGRELSVSLRGGLGLNYAFYGEFREFGYEDYEGNYYGPHDYFLEYGREGWPKRFNAQAEMALSFRCKMLQVGLTYSRGLTDHRFYRADGDYKTRQNKFALSVALVLSD